MRNEISLLLLLIVIGGTVKLPENWPLCKRGPTMNECLKSAIEIAIRDLYKGNRTLGVASIDPWKIKTFDYNQRTGPVAVRFGAREITTLGFKNTRVDRVVTDWKTIDVYLRTATLSSHGNYFVNGSVIYLPISGKGKYLLNMEGFTSNMRLHLDRYSKKGKEFFKVREAHFFVGSSDLKLRFDNLFNGNAFLGDRMNDVINRNWKLILETASPLISKALAEPLKQLSNGLFSRVPVDVIIPK